MEHRYKREMMRVLDTRLNARSFDGRAVLLFGHCNATEEMADYLLSRSVVPAAILDNSESKQGLNYREIPVLPPAQTQKYNAKSSIVLIATRFFAEMSAQLRRLGYEGEIVQVVEYNTFAEYSLSDETIERKTARMLRGVKTLELIREQHPVQHLIVCPNNALGDVYWAIAFLPAYCKKHSIADVTVVVTGSGCRQVAELFDTAGLVELEHEAMDEFVQALIYTREENCIIAHHDCPYTDNIIKYLDKHLLSFIDYYRCAVYGLPKNAEPAPPTRHQTFVGATRLIKGKTVFIAPYAKSVVEPPGVFWEDLAADWHRKGYVVYTCVNGGEQPVRGTEPLTVRLDQIKDAAECAGVFIGLRSGLCDIVHTADCRKIVVFPDCYYSTTPHKAGDFFDLPGWERVVV